MKNRKGALHSGLSFCVLAGSVCLVGGGAQAQDTNKDTGYKVGENKPVLPTESAPTPDTTWATAPQRFIRIDYVRGDVSWRADGNAAWTKAAVNQSLSEGGQIRVTDGGRAEIRFNDGSLLRLGDHATVTLQTVYSDSQGEFTQIKMDSGLATLRLKLERSVYQVDAGAASIKATGPAEVRIGTGKDTRIGVIRGQVTVEGKPGKTTLHAGNYLAVGSADSAYDITRLPAEDSWDRWNDERDRLIDAPGRVYYPVPYRVYAPAPSFFFGLSVPIGPGYHRYWGRGLRWSR